MATQCSIIQANQKWDLSSLASTTSDYNITLPSGDAFMLNICRPVVSELWKIDQPDTVSVFLRTSQGDRSLGSPANLTLASTTSSPHPQIIMTNGAPCSASPVLSSSIISFVCAAPGGASAGPELVAMLPPGADASESCAFLFEWRTPAACPKVAGGGHLGDVGAVAVLFAMAIIVFLAYILGTVLYNRFILKLRGTDQLPAFSAPRLASVSNPFRRGEGPFGGGWRAWFGRNNRRNGSGGYGRVSMADGGDQDGDSDEEEGLVGRFGLDSDDEDDRDARALSGDPRVWRSDDEVGKTSTAHVGGGGGSAGLINLG